MLALRLLCTLVLCSWSVGALAADDSGQAAARTEALKTFKSQVSPFINTYCAKCHTGNKQKGGVTFSTMLSKPDLPSFFAVWKKVAAQVKTHDMPPEEHDKQPTDNERAAVVEWIAGLKRLAPKDPGPFVIRRLNKVEYGNTLHDLFGVDAKVAQDLPDEVFGAGYTNSLSPMLVEQYLAVANDVMNKVVSQPGQAPTEVQRRLFGADPAKGEDRVAAARKVAKSLARLAYRRPATDGEIELLLRVFALANDQGKSYSESLKLMTKAILVSPQFLFITPGDLGKASSEIVPLDDYQLASRLSYLLWATMPDAELSALADAGKLRDPKVLADQARRLMKNPRSRAFFDGFGAQWLGLDKLAGKSFDTAKFPQMTAELRAAMYDEARLLFEDIVRENRSITRFIDSDYTYLNESLSAIYGISSKTPSLPSPGVPREGSRGDAKVLTSQFQKVQLTDGNRGGILTMPGVLAMSSFPNRTSAVNRGVWVLEQVLGEHVPPPPANVPPLDKQDKQQIASMTLRQRTELHRSNAVCANCHKILDPIGFGLENFDAIGRWRDKDESGGAIDATGELPGGKRFTTPAQLKRIIAERKDDFGHNLTGKLLAYALCRQLEGYDEVVVDQLAADVAKDEYRMQTLVVGVVTSYPFTHRRVGNNGDTSHAK